MSIFKKITAEDSSIAIGGDNNAPIRVNNYVIDSKSIQSPSLEELFGKSINDKAVLDILNVSIKEASKLIDKNQPSAAKSILESIEAKHDTYLNSTLKASIKKNIGLCEFRTGNFDSAAENFHSAYSLDPNSPDAIAKECLALLIESKDTLAFDFASKQLEINPNNSELACYLIQSSLDRIKVTDIETIIPNVLLDVPNVLVYRIKFFSYREQYDDALALAKQSRINNPSHKDINIWYAQSVLFSIFNNKKFIFSHFITDDQYQSLLEANEILSLKWTEFIQDQSSNFHTSHLNDLWNLIITNEYLGNSQNIISLIESAKIKAKDCINMLKELAFFAASTYQESLILDVISKIPEQEVPELINFKLACAKEDIEFLINFNEGHISTFPEAERVPAYVILELAKIKSRNMTCSEDDVTRLEELASDNIQSLCLIADSLHKDQEMEVIDYFYSQAKKLLDESTKYEDRERLCSVAMRKDEYSFVINALESNVPTQFDNEGLYCLASAYLKLRPIQARTFHFFETLSDSVSNNPRYQILLAFLNYDNANYSEALDLCVSYRKQNKVNLQSLIFLFQIHLNLENEIEIGKELKKIRFNEMVGTPLQKITLARYIAKYKDNLEGLQNAYVTLCENSNNPEVIQQYIGLMLISESPIEVPNSECVEPGYVITLKNNHNETFQFLYSEDTEVNHRENQSKKNRLVKKADGLKLHDSFEYDKSFGLVDKWEVVEIKHKYLDLLHSHLNSFQTKFPDEDFLQINLPSADDISPLLNIIQQQSESVQKRLQLYSEKSIPLSLLSKYLKNCNSIETAELLVRSNIDIHSDTFGFEHRSNEIKKLSEKGFKALAFDTYTVWKLSFLGLLPTLKKSYKLLIPKSSIEEIKQLTPMFNQPLTPEFTIGYSEGKFYKDEWTKERLAQREKYIKEQIKQIESNCEIIDVVWDHEPNEACNAFIKIGGEKFWDSALLSKQNNVFLVSEDLFYRQWSVFAFGDSIQESSLQSLLTYLNNEKNELLSNDVYANALALFSMWRHIPVYFTVENIIDVYSLDDTDELLKLKPVLSFLEKDNQDLYKNGYMVSELIKGIRSIDDNDPTKLEKAIQLALDLFIKNLKEEDQAFGFLIVCILLGDDSNKMMVDWREKNSISDSQVESAYKRILDQRKSSDN